MPLKGVQPSSKLELPQDVSFHTFPKNNGHTGKLEKVVAPPIQDAIFQSQTEGGAGKMETAHNIDALLAPHGHAIGDPDLNAYANGDFNGDGTRDFYYRFGDINVYLDGATGAYHESAYTPKDALWKGVKPY